MQVFYENGQKICSPPRPGRRARKCSHYYRPDHHKISMPLRLSRLIFTSVVFLCVYSFRHFKHCSIIVPRKMRFDEYVASTWSRPVQGQFQRFPDGWAVDQLHAGVKVGDLTVLLRPTNYACVVHDETSNLIHTLPAANLAQQISAAPIEKKKAISTLLDLFDTNRVQEIAIRMPLSANAPYTFDPKTGAVQRDAFHPYVLITYNDGSPTLVAPCTSEIWSPRKSPMKMAVLDKNFGCDSNSCLWSDGLTSATAIDLSRLASFPPQDVPNQFQQEPLCRATNPGAVMTAMRQIVLVHAALDGNFDEFNWERDGDDGFDRGEFDIGTHGEEFEDVDLVIGSYEVDDEGRPLPEGREG